jgi:hypothetical protein
MTSGETPPPQGLDRPNHTLGTSMERIVVAVPLMVRTDD